MKKKGNQIFLEDKEYKISDLQTRKMKYFQI